MAACGSWDSKIKPRRGLIGTIKAREHKSRPEIRPAPKIWFNSSKDAEVWAAIYADESCHPFNRWEVERVAGVFSVAIYHTITGKFCHWAEP